MNTTEMAELIQQIKAAHDTEEDGNNLVAVCRDAHNAELREARREIRENQNESPDITSEQVLAWLKAKADASGIKGLELVVSTKSNRFTASVTEPYWIESGDTAEKAIHNFRASFPSPETLAQNMRDQAHRLLAKAEALDAEGKS